MLYYKSLELASIFVINADNYAIGSDACSLVGGKYINHTCKFIDINTHTLKVGFGNDYQLYVQHSNKNGNSYTKLSCYSNSCFSQELPNVNLKQDKINMLINHQYSKLVE